MAFDPKEYFEALAEAAVSARWAFLTGLGLAGVLWLTQAAWLTQLIGPDFSTAKYGLLVVPLFAYWKYVRTRSAGLARASSNKADFIAQAQTSEHARLAASLDILDVCLTSATWNRSEGFVEIGTKLFSPALASKEIRSIKTDATGNVTPICVEIIAAGVRGFMVPLVAGEKTVSVGGDNRILRLSFLYKGTLPHLSLSPDTWATSALFVLHTSPPLNCQGVLPITGDEPQ
jgi:hypothetical protein